MEDKMEILLEKMDKFENKIDKIEKKMDHMQEEMNDMHEEMNNMHEEMNDMHEEIREVKDQQLLFENDYGTKIDAIFDAVTLELDKNLEKSQKIRKLEERMDRSDVKSFGYEKRISSLELKS